MTTVVTQVARTESFDLELPDGRVLRVQDTGGDGELVVVHHGTPGSGLLADTWVADAAARGIRLVGFDRAGYGGSSRHQDREVGDVVADVAAIADALGATTFRTWGVSGGGPHALACAALLPDRCLAAVSVAGVAPYDAGGLDWLAGMGQDNLDEFGAAVRGEGPLAEYLSAAREELLSTTPETLGSAMESLLPEVDRVALRAGMATVLHAQMSDGLAPGIDGWLDDDLAFVGGWGFDVAKVEVPTLLLQGDEDLMVPFAHGVWLSEHVAGAQARLLPGLGHVSLAVDAAPVHEWLLSQG